MHLLTPPQKKKRTKHANIDATGAIFKTLTKSKCFYIRLIYFLFPPSIKGMCLGPFRRGKFVLCIITRAVSKT